MKPMEPALFVRAFISVFSFERNLLRFCGFRRYLARFLIGPYAPSFINPHFTMDHNQNRLFLQANPK